MNYKKATDEYSTTFSDAGLNFVYQLCNDLLNIPKSDMIVVKGDTQSGKEKFTISSAFKSLFENRIPVIITRRITDDADKLERSIINYSSIFDIYIKENNIKQDFNISCIRVSSDEDLNNIKSFTPSIIVSLGNYSQLSNVLKFATNFESKFDLYIDEIDNIDYGKDSQASTLLKEIKNLSYKTFGITATPLDCIFSEDELKSADIIKLSKPDDYRGFIDICVKLLQKDKKIVAINKKITNFEDILNSDKNLQPFLDEFSKSKPEFAWTIKKYIPNICLIKNSRINVSQETLFNSIIQKYSGEFAIILYNGNGVKIYYPNMPREIIYKKNHIKPDINIDIDITEALQFLKDNGDVKMFPRIIIISGELAGRCTSFVSRDYNWHLTDMYYNPSKSTPIPEMIQSCGRLCGRNKGKSHLYLHCTKLVADALYKGFFFTNEIIERAIKNPLIHENEEVSFSKSIKEVSMNNQKFPKGRNITCKIIIKKKDFNLVKNVDNGYNLEAYKYTNEDEECDEEQNQDISDEIKSSLKEIGNEEFKRLISMFKKWSLGSSKISIFMQNLNPDKVYNEDELKDLCENNVKRIALVTTKNFINGSGWGKILQKKENNYKLHPCLIEEFKKYF